MIQQNEIIHGLYWNGLIGEINRLVLHPRRMHLEIAKSETGTILDICNLRTGEVEEYAPEALQNISNMLKRNNLVSPVVREPQELPSPSEAEK